MIVTGDKDSNNPTIYDGGRDSGPDAGDEGGSSDGEEGRQPAGKRGRRSPQRWW